MISVLTAAAVPTAAQDASQSAGDEARARAYDEFVRKAPEWLPTVNVIDPERLPVTFPYTDILDHIVIDVAFGDDEPVPFMLDTGAPTIVSQAIADAHGGEVLVETLNRAGGDILFWAPLQKYPALTVAGAVIIAEASGQGPWEAPGELHCITPHGLLGATAMRNAVWQIDYGAQEITVAASVDQLDHVEDAIALPFTPDPGLSPTPRLRLGVGEGTLEFIVDSGAGIPLAIDADSLASVGVEVPADAPVSATLAFGAAGAFDVPAAFMDVPIMFGETEVETPVVVAPGLAPGADGNIGHAFLRHFVVTFDWATNTMYLDPLGDGGIPPLDDPAAAGIAWSDGQLVVAALPKGGRAEAAGLTVGEVITHIDGESVEGLSLDQYCSGIAGQAHATITTVSGTYDASPVEGFFEGTGR